jgi:hypothetical protein
MMIMLEPAARGLARKKSKVVNYPDGRFAGRFNGTSLPFRIFDRIQLVDAGKIVENKRLGAALAMIRLQQDAFEPRKRRHDPRRQRPSNSLETSGAPTKGRPSREVLSAISG